MLVRNILFCVLLLSAVIAHSDETSFKDLRKIVSGDKTLELVQTRQLTTPKDGVIDNVFISPNGKFLVYSVITPDLDSPNRKMQLYLVRSIGGKPALLFEGGGQYNDIDIGESNEWNIVPYTVWSPDSNLFTVIVWHKAPQSADDNDEAPPHWDYSILVFDTKGSEPIAINTPGGSFPWTRQWNPDSRRILISYAERSNPDSDPTYNVVVFNTKTRQSETVFSRSCRHLWAQRWDETGEAFLCYETRRDLPGRNLKIHLNGKPVEESEGKLNVDFHERSDDGNGPLRLTNEVMEDLAKISNVATGDVVSTIEFPKGSYGVDCLWVPHSNLITYTMGQSLQDTPSSKTSKIRTLWLFYPGGRRFDRVCVALDSSRQASWSNNATKVAYISNGCAYMADLEWRQATLREKAAAGVKLTEDETKELMLENARQIADAVRRYVFSAEYFPPNDKFIEVMNRNLKDRDALMMPGTDKIACTYTQPENYPSRKEKPEIIIATLDAGYQWKVCIYADYHIVMVDKK